MTFDALVIGGGPAGATAALLLARAGWSVAVVEKESYPRRKVCGEFISATTRPLLRELGVEQAYDNCAGPEVRRVGLFVDETVLAAPMPVPNGAHAHWGRALGRESLDALLLDAAAQAGAQVFQPWRAEKLQPLPDGDHACLISAGNEQAQIVARIVIAGNGSWEKGAGVRTIDRQHRPSDLLAFKAHFRDSDLPADLMPLVVFPGGYGGMVTTDNGRVTLSCCIRRDVLARARARSPGRNAGDAVLDYIRTHCAGVRAALGRARLDGAWLSAGPIRPGIRGCYENGVFFVGNLAGEAHPIIAEGISMAMQSSWLLCRHLIAQRDDPSRFDIGHAYEADWRAAFATRLHAAALFAHVCMRPSAARWLPLLRHFPGLLTFGARWSGKARLLAPARSEAA